MTGLDRVKAEIMIYAIRNDYFAFGSVINLQKNGRYKAIIDGKVFYTSLTQLAKDWDTLTDDMKRVVSEAYISSILI